jgi:hypothetical protein
VDVDWIGLIPKGIGAEFAFLFLDGLYYWASWWRNILSKVVWPLPTKVGIEEIHHSMMR